MRAHTHTHHARTAAGNKHFNLEHVEEAFTSEHWIVRIYKVKPQDNRF